MKDIPFDDQREHPELKGRVVKRAFYAKDDAGYPFFYILFEDGTWLQVIESGQAGWIGYRIDNSTLNPVR